MSIFDPKPVYRVASRAENLAMALDMPFSPLKNLWEQTQQGAIDSFGLGTIIKDFSIPRSVAPDTTPRPVTPGLDPISLAVSGYEAVRGAFGAQPSGKVLSQEEWKASPYARDGLPWDAGMTEARAAALAATWDQRQARAYFGQKDMVTTLAGGFLGNLVDPINYVPIFGPAARLAAATKFGFVAGHALIGASEAAINTAVFGALTTPARASLGDDVSWEAAINNIAFSAAAGAVFGAGGGAWAKFRSTRVAKAEAGLKAQVETIKNLEASRAALNDAVTSLATTGEVKLTPATATTLERMASEVTDRRTSARALDRETAQVTGTKAGEVVIAPSGTRVAIRPEVVDISTLQRAEGDLQVRDRSGRNAVSNAQIEDIALNLDPARLMPNVDGSQGAPLVGPDNVVDSGNGRVASILRASEAYPQKYAAYKQAIADAGYSIEGIDRPVLISRRVTDLSPDARAQFNAELNSSTTARMSAVETAAMDRAALDDVTLAQFADAPVESAANKAFVSRFLANIPQNERAALLDTSGNLSADGVRRLENALVAAAYGDVDVTVLRRFAEATDSNTRAIVGAMSDVAGKWTLMRRAVKAGEIDPEFDQTVELTDALRHLSRWRDQAAKEKRPVSVVIKEGMDQGDMISGEIDMPTRAFILSFYNSSDFGQAAGRETIAGRLSDLVDTTLEAGRPSLFGDAYAATKLGVLKHAFGSDVEAALREIERLAESADQIGGAGGRRASGAAGQANPRGAGQGGRGGRNAAEIAGTMAERFTAAGRSPEEAQANGVLIGQFYETLARRSGMSTADLVDRFGLPEVRAADVAPEGALAQAFVPGRMGFNAVSPSVYPEAGAAVDGLTVRKSIPNRDSIAATFDDGDYTILKGVREIPFAAFRGVEPGVMPTVDARTRALADEIKANGEINPLIVVLDKEGPYVLEGAHRFDALQLAGKESLPALVVVDHSEGTGIEILPDDAKVKFEAPDPRQLALFQSGQETINTPRFRAWFSGSKVVDAEGKPLVVYHGTVSEGGIDAFDLGMANEGGIFFSADRAHAGAFAADGPDRMVEAYVRLENPLEWDGATVPVHHTPGDVASIIEKAKAEGRDGVIIRNFRDAGHVADTYIAFDPTQIKSVNNRGTFDPNDPRILFQPAYHGTPHIFDKFDSSKIGTGEGAQAFGFGLYFAGRKEVAQFYKDTLTKDTVGPARRALEKAGNDVDAAIAATNAEIARLNALDLTPESGAAKRESLVATQEANLRELTAFKETGNWKSGRLLTVDIPDDSELMVWDAPLSEQSDAVKAALEKVAPVRTTINGQYVRDWVRGRFTGDVHDMNFIESALRNHPDNVEAAITEFTKAMTTTADGKPIKGQMAELQKTTAATIGEALRKAEVKRGKMEIFGEQKPTDLPEDNPFAGVAIPEMSGETFYRMLSRELGGDAQASAALREAGIPGHAFLDQQSRGAAPENQTHNYVIYDDSRVNVTGFEQPARGAIQFGDTGSIITLLKNADASTALHETGHHFLMMFKSLAERPDAPDAIAGDWARVKAWWDSNADAVAADSPMAGVTGADVRAVLTDGTTGDRVKDLAINVGLQEQWARGFEAYLREGVAPSEGLRGVFEQFRQWLVGVYRSIVDLNVNLSPEIRQVFDNLLSPAERDQASLDLTPPRPVVDMQEPRPDPVPEGLDLAAGRVLKSEDTKSLAEQFGVDEAGKFLEEADIEQMRTEGRLTAEDETALAAADQVYADAEAYAETLRVAAACMV